MAIDEPSFICTQIPCHIHHLTETDMCVAGVDVYSD